MAIENNAKVALQYIFMTMRIQKISCVNETIENNVMVVWMGGWVGTLGVTEDWFRTGTMTKL